MESHRVIIDPISITLYSLREIWLADPSSIKDEATKLLTYIHVCGQIDRNAPFFDADPNEVRALCAKEIYGDYEWDFKIPFDKEFLDNAIAEYQVAYETSAEASARSYNKKIHEIRRQIDTTPIQIKENTIKGVTVFESNFPLISKMMLDLGKIFDAKQGLEERIKTDKEKAGTIRGEKKISFLEKRQEELDKIKRRTETVPEETPGF